MKLSGAFKWAVIAAVLIAANASDVATDSTALSEKDDNEEQRELYAEYADEPVYQTAHTTPPKKPDTKPTTGTHKPSGTGGGGGSGGGGGGS
eukprot:CAMPEP_0194027972 /NCGR_PEP_ID=MMETSP0009_2-20130614/2009_1 /TAXON_ID=210454 /ORGANISM="Grammatophora oceanica, Strain CCMP 410" /LENGTH=91 /DNA_ID=CAMNT_0038667191 /DNA_START=99 /DNA_END=371 /DNA_ORIENTATION=-